MPTLHCIYELSRAFYDVGDSMSKSVLRTAEALISHITRHSKSLGIDPGNLPEVSRVWTPEPDPLRKVRVRLKPGACAQLKHPPKRGEKPIFGLHIGNKFIADGEEAEITAAERDALARHFELIADPARAASVRSRHRGLEQARAGPIVELSV